MVLEGVERLSESSPLLGVEGAEHLVSLGLTGHLTDSGTFRFTVHPVTSKQRIAYRGTNHSILLMEQVTIFNS